MIRDRLAQLVALFGGNNRKFALKIGMDPSYVGKMISGRNEPSESMQIMISHKCGISLHWLQTGEGEMFEGREGLVEGRFLEPMGAFAPEESGAAPDQLVGSRPKPKRLFAAPADHSWLGDTVRSARVRELLRMARVILEAGHDEISAALESNVIAFYGALMRDWPDKKKNADT